MVRLGLLVNPDAGLGGRLGLKGSDGQAELARSMGAEDRSGPRMRMMFEHFSRIHREKSHEIEWVTSQGRMGSDWIPEDLQASSFIHVHESSSETSAEDTGNAIEKIIESEIQLLVYSGGDGTTRDIVSALESAGSGSLPVIGVPSGVKMHSGCFASSPKAAAEVLSAWIHGDLLVSSTEVLGSPVSAPWKNPGPCRRVPRDKLLLAGPKDSQIYTIIILTIGYRCNRLRESRSCCYLLRCKLKE